MLHGKLDSSEFVHEMRDFFLSLSGIWETMTTQIHVLAANAIKASVHLCLLSTKQTIH